MRYPDTLIALSPPRPSLRVSLREATELLWQNVRQRRREAAKARRREANPRFPLGEIAELRSDGLVRGSRVPDGDRAATPGSRPRSARFPRLLGIEKA